MILARKCEFVVIRGFECCGRTSSPGGGSIGSVGDATISDLQSSFIGPNAFHNATGLGGALGLSSTGSSRLTGSTSYDSISSPTESLQSLPVLLQRVVCSVGRDPAGLVAQTGLRIGASPFDLVPQYAIFPTLLLKDALGKVLFVFRFWRRFGVVRACGCACGAAWLARSWCMLANTIARQR